jgi:hypothetical protein
MNLEVRKDIQLTLNSSCHYDMKTQYNKGIWKYNTALTMNLLPSIFSFTLKYEDTNKDGEILQNQQAIFSMIPLRKIILRSSSFKIQMRKY